MPVEVKINNRTYTCTIGPESIETIAREHLGLKTLATRGSDALDFSEHGVASIRDALTAAYNAGKAARDLALGRAQDAERLRIEDYAVQKGIDVLRASRDLDVTTEDIERLFPGEVAAARMELGGWP